MHCSMYTFSENVQRSAESCSATDLDQASLGAEACVKGEREREGGGGGGVKGSAHFALQILVTWHGLTIERFRDRQTTNTNTCG